MATRCLLGMIGTARAAGMRANLPWAATSLANRYCSMSVGLRHGYATVSASSSSVLPQTIKPSQDEISSCTLGPRNLEIAVRALHNDGLVVIEDAIAHPVLDKLNEKMVEDCRTLQARGKDGPFNYNVGNLQVDPPPVKRFFDDKVFLNPIATQVTSSVLGPRPKWTFCSGNAAMPPIEGMKPQRQPVHSDADFAHPGHPFALVVNVPLVTMTPENGSTEIWLGTHQGYGIEAQEGMHGERASGRVREELLEERRGMGMGPCQPVVKKGSVVVRDLRLWHAGMPNLSEDVRVMLAMSELSLLNLIQERSGADGLGSPLCALVSESDEGGAC